MSIWKNKNGVTLIEVLIAISLFTIVSVVSSNVLLDIVRLEKQSSVQNALYEDMRIILQQLTNEIQDGVIDYEEYYSVCVIQGACDNNQEAYYGLNYGVYGSRFYDPGSRTDKAPTQNPTDLGAECQYPSPLDPGEACQLVYSFSVDLDTGQNPFSGNESDASAFCEAGRGVSDACDNKSSVTVDQLYLLDQSGSQKTILAKKRLSDAGDYGIGKVVMLGKDMDQNGFMDVFSCADDYQCYGVKDGQESTLKDFIHYPINAGGAVDGAYILNNNIRVPQKDDLNLAFEGNVPISQFVPITPMVADVKKLEFTIHPIEDPYKAYSEDAVQSHPSVSILLEIGLSAAAEADYPGTFKPLVVQTTVASGVVGKIESYPPVNDVRDQSSGSSWMEAITWGSSFLYSTP